MSEPLNRQQKKEIEIVVMNHMDTWWHIKGHKTMLKACIKETIDCVEDVIK